MNMSKRVFPIKREESEFHEVLAKDPVKAKAYDRYVRDHERRLRQLEREARGENVPGDYDNGYEE